MSYTFTKEERKELQSEFRKAGFERGQIISQFDSRVGEIERRVLERHGKYSTEFFNGYEMFKSFKIGIITIIIFLSLSFLILFFI